MKQRIAGSEIAKNVFECGGANNETEKKPNHYHEAATRERHSEQWNTPSELTEAKYDSSLSRAKSLGCKRQRARYQHYRQYRHHG
jgi:hypothetical protein